MTWVLDQLLKKELRNNLLTSKRSRKLPVYNISVPIKKAFETKFRKIGVHNPLLAELENNGVMLLWLWKLSMISPGKSWLRPWFVKMNRYKIFNKNRYPDMNYTVYTTYSEVITLLFLSPVREDVIKERVWNNNLVSKSLEIWGLTEWLGL